jgi:hypothetical protein
VTDAEITEAIGDIVTDVITRAEVALERFGELPDHRITVVLTVGAHGMVASAALPEIDDDHADATHLVAQMLASSAQVADAEGIPFSIVTAPMIGGQG